MKKPNAVRYAETLIWAEIALEIALTVLDARIGYLSERTAIRHICFCMLFCAVPYNIGRGRDWARHIYGVWEFGGYAMLILKSGDGAPGFEWHAYWATLPLALLSICLLFTSQGWAWFDPAHHAHTSEPSP